LVYLQDEGAPPPINVLEQHRKKNRANQPPKLARLAAAALHQAKIHNQDDENNLRESDDDQDGQDEEQDQRATRHSKSSGQTKPDTLAYYKGTPWWAILMNAKMKYRLHITLNHGFPDRDDHLCDARNILLEAIDEFKVEHDIVDQGGPITLHIVHSLIA
jgi:hypothetical protein